MARSRLTRGSAIAAALGVGAATVIAVPALAGTTMDRTRVDTVIQVQPNERLSPVSAALMGVNHRTNFDAHGMWDPDRRRVEPAALAGAQRAGLGMVRFPGGTEANLYDFKRAIGPPEQRGCQTDARKRGDGPMASDYGPDEHMGFVEKLDGEAMIMAPIARGTPGDAADWVEYMNAEVGSNPNGGVAWAKRRADNGHPQPYGVKWWELGNEHDRLVERYWMSQDNDKAIRQYAFGGTERKVGELAAVECDHRDSASVSDGSAGQEFEVRYAPVVADSQTVYVDDVTWRPVSDLADAGPDDPVYTFAPKTGAIVFGDGTHGRIPPAGARVTVDYDSGPHGGFVDYYRAMKEVDPHIDVCSNWAPITEKTGLGGITFPELMAEEGHADDYDCVTIHPYTHFGRDFGNGRSNPWDTQVQGHDQHIIGNDRATELVDDLASEVKRHGRKDAYVAVSEFGALWGPWPTDPPFYDWNTSMSHALYMASQWAGYANRGMPWSVGNALIDKESLRTVLGPAPDFVHTSEAVTREATRPLVADGSTTVATEIGDNPVRKAKDGSYGVFAATASRSADGSLVLMVVNRHPFDAYDVRVTVGGHPGGHARIAVVGSDSFASFNSADHPEDVAIERGVRETPGGSFRHTFPAHSVTVIQLD